jgi:hypothetical protein
MSKFVKLCRKFSDRLDLFSSFIQMNAALALSDCFMKMEKF